ncbi:MAG: MBL fold metallo-hydrolase [Candidatus Helarchaeota archaeon]
MFEKDFMGLSEPVRVIKDVCMIPAFGNVGVVETDEGLVIFDIALKLYEKKIFRELRKLTDKPVKYIIYSHGHFDHCFGFKLLIEEIKKKGWEMPNVIGHENCIKRFEKYKMMEGHQNFVNSQQFASVNRGGRNVVSAKETLDPNIIVYGNEDFTFKLGQYTFELYPEWGETDDAIWMYVPEKNTIFSGDMIISSYPNIGNPYKVQRYPKRWAEGLERMMIKDADYLIPGHGPLIKGKKRIKECLSITAEALRFVHDEVVKRLNKGMWFEELYHDMLGIYPEKFKKSKWLQPLYGCYEMGIHASYRLYHGWYNTGNPTDLYPSKSADIAAELLKIVGPNSEEKYFEHAEKLIKEGKFQLALHIVDVIIKGTDQKNLDILLKAYKLKRNILKEKIKTETSFISKNILNNGAIQIKTKIKEIEKNKKDS